jgi:hypothetical protein
MEKEIIEKELPKTFYSLLEAIRHKPAMYLGRKSVNDLHIWLQGYFYAKIESGIPLSAQEKEFKEFNKFIQEKYDWHDVGSWAAKIAYYNRSEETAFEKFFELLDEFKKSKS